MERNEMDGELVPVKVTRPFDLERYFVWKPEKLNSPRATVGNFRVIVM
jgi:hypothetical protein